ncbi:MAG TPA: peptidylprolyl isomerase [Gammaproteobacteria bacterium]|nr:peptidylprolyl isomerase [Gammaproteobacteria bacterium]
MKSCLRALVAFGALCGAGVLQATEVAICTDSGRAVLELADEAAPQHVASFLRYVDMGYYSGTVFHRVQQGLFVQGGGLDRELRVRSTLPAVPNESSNGLHNTRGTVAAARTDDPDSARSQFFVNLADNTQLDAGREPGYTVFARVTEGIEVFDAIGRLPTGGKGPFRAEVPTPLVAIKSIARIDEAALAALPADGREAALKEAIAAAAAAGNAADALTSIGHYRALCGAEDPEIALTEARMALALDDRRRATFALEELMATTDAEDPAHVAAVDLAREAAADNAMTSQLLAVCAPPAVPALPDASSVSEEEMLAAQRQVREFVAAGETYLACLSRVIDDEERSAGLRNAAVEEHNRMVAAMEEIAAGFNEQIRIFKARG